VPNTATADEGAGVVFYKGCDDIVSTGNGWNWNSNLENGARYRIVANPKDPQARTYPIDVTLETLPELPVVTIAAATPATLTWAPRGFAAFQGTNSFRVERADNVPTGTPPVDGPGQTWTSLGNVTAPTVTFTDGTAAAATKYFYRVTGTSTINSLTNTSAAVRNFPASPTVSFPAANLTATALRVTWGAATLATTYDVQRAPNVPAGTPPVDGPGTYASVGTVPSTATALQLDVTGLTTGTKYWFRVVATNGNNNTSTTGAGRSVTTP
jgi:hypothetical protein